MASTVFPAASGGGIKTVQRGSAGASGNVTITSVDIAKSFVTIFGSASSGTVVPSFSLAVAANGTTTNAQTQAAYRPDSTNQNTVISTARNLDTANYSISANNQWYTAVATGVAANYNVTAGSNNLVSAVVTGFLANSTTLTVSGACRYEIVEFA